MAAARLRSVTASSRELRSAAAVRTVASSRSFDQGLETKSVAPRFIASTAIWTPPWAVIITTTASGSRFRISASQWKPSAALVAPRPKLASSRTTSARAVHRPPAPRPAPGRSRLREQVAQQQARGQTSTDVRIVVDDDRTPSPTWTRGRFDDFLPLRARVEPSVTVYLDAVEGGRVEQKRMVEDGAVVQAGPAARGPVQFRPAAERPRAPDRGRAADQLDAQPGAGAAQTRSANQRDLNEADLQAQQGAAPV
jgi:hypothetical protein